MKLLLLSLLVGVAAADYYPWYQNVYNGFSITLPNPYCGLFKSALDTFIGSKCKGGGPTSENRLIIPKALYSHSIAEGALAEFDDDVERVFDHFWFDADDPEGFLHFPDGNFVPVTGPVLPGDLVLVNNHKKREIGYVLEVADAPVIAINGRKLLSGEKGKAAKKAKSEKKSKKSKDSKGKTKKSEKSPKTCKSHKSNKSNCKEKSYGGRGMKDVFKAAGIDHTALCDAVLSTGSMEFWIPNPPEFVNPNSPPPGCDRWDMDSKSSKKERKKIRGNRGKEGLAIVSARRKKIAIDKGMYMSQKKNGFEDVLFLRAVIPEYVVCGPTNMEYELKRLHPAAPLPFCPESSDITVMFEGFDDGNFDGVPYTMNDDLDPEGDFLADGASAVPVKTNLFVAVHGVTGLDDKQWVTQGSSYNIIDALVGAGATAPDPADPTETLVMVMDYSYTSSGTVDDNKLVGLANIGPLSKILAAAMLKYVKQRQTAAPSVTDEAALGSITCIGKDLGAHICGEAARTVTAMLVYDDSVTAGAPFNMDSVLFLNAVRISNKKIARISALNPPSLYEINSEADQYSTWNCGLVTTSATFIDKYFTSGSMGGTSAFKETQVASVSNFYFGDVTVDMPGCSTGDCNHNKVSAYYLASVVTVNGGGTACLSNTNTECTVPQHELGTALTDSTCAGAASDFVGLGLILSPTSPTSYYYDVTVADTPDFC